MRPFFCYYGGKWRSAPKLYPPPAHELIVEPFAGAAGYSLRYPARRVLLRDVDPLIVGLWRYLLRVTPAEVLAIPDLGPGETTEALRGVPQEARWLVGFWLNKGTERPRLSPSKWMRSGIRPGSFWGPRVRETIAGQLDGIRHWKVEEGDYRGSPEERATWFIDPPYQVAGAHYRHGKIDYGELGAWCRSRVGQVIACENEGADWLPFGTASSVKATRPGRSSEVSWVQP